MNKNGKRKLAVMLIMAIFVSACSKQVNENSSVAENPSESETQTSVSVTDDVETIMTEEERSVYFFLRGNESAGPKLSVEKRMDLIQYTFVLYTPAEDDTKNEGRRSQKSVTEVFEKDGETQYVMTYRDGSRIDIPPAHLELGYFPDGVKRDPGDTSKYEKEGHKLPTAVSTLEHIDTPTILFFLGILMAVSCLKVVGILGHLAGGLNTAFGTEAPGFFFIDLIIGVLSSIVDNVPLVAAVMGMYPIDPDTAIFATNHPFWEFLAYCAGTGGSLLIIGSAAGVAVMGMEKIDFIWYLKKISWLALLGYIAGAIVFVLMDITLFENVPWLRDLVLATPVSNPILSLV